MPTRKVIVSCAITGSIHVPSQSDALPVTPAQIAEQAIGAAEAGATVLHLHARDPQTGARARTRTSSPSSCPRSGPAATP